MLRQPQSMVGVIATQPSRFVQTVVRSVAKCDGTGYRIVSGTAKRIGLRSAKRIRPGTAKRIRPL